MAEAALREAALREVSFYEEFGSLLSEICSHSPLAAGRPFFWTIIANPKAGGFTIKQRREKHLAQLNECKQRAAKNPVHEFCGPSETIRRAGGSDAEQGLVFTRARGHAKEITEALIGDASKAAATAGKRPFHLIITAGGDGTSLEVMSALCGAGENLREDFAVLRLPMGTANDGADSFFFFFLLNLIIEPPALQKQRAIRLRTASGKGPFFAFNILSVGLDAFVTHMTNKMKGKLPGDSYKLWVDIAALFYDKIYKVGVIDVNSTDENGKEGITLKEKLLLIAVGESGRRCYGSQQWILPDDRNVCAIRQMPLFRKIALKGLFSNGTHADKNEAILWNSSRVTFQSQYPLLAQMDGETVLLEENDFPAVIELTEPVINILGKRDRRPWSRAAPDRV
jgi:diacylglycerol kinase family enzyme